LSSDGRAGRPAGASQNARCLRPGDIVTVTRIDRLARSTFDLFGIVKRIADAKAQFRQRRHIHHSPGDVSGVSQRPDARARYSSPHASEYFELKARAMQPMSI
jgi:resolvase-like protein